MNSDGTGMVNLTNDTYRNDAPQLSPDGSQIVFVSNSGSGGGYNDVFVMNSDGSGATQLTSDPQWGEDYPSWSPDGSQIMYSSLECCDYEVFIMNADGSNVTQITDMAGGERYPALQPSNVLPATSVTVNPASDIITAIGHTVQLNATARNAFGEVIESPTINWSSEAD